MIERFVFRQIPTKNGGKVLWYDPVDLAARDVYATGTVSPVHGLLKRTIDRAALAETAPQIGARLEIENGTTVTSGGTALGQLTPVGRSAAADIGATVVLVTGYRLDAQGRTIDVKGIAGTDVNLEPVVAALRRAQHKP